MESELEKLIFKLGLTAKESTISKYEMDNVNEYMHVEREIQRNLIRLINKIHGRKLPHLIFLTGSSGDGKSHMFAYLKSHSNEIPINDFEIYMDATESFDPSKYAEDCLEIRLNAYSDAELEKEQEKRMIIAINLGVLNRFISKETVKKKYSKLCAFIKDSGIFERGIGFTQYPEDVDDESTYFTIVNFSGYNELEFADNDDLLFSPYITKLFDKVFAKSSENIFLKAYETDLGKNICTDCHWNYQLLQNDNIRDGLVNLIIQAKVTHNLILPTRVILDFINKIILPSQSTDEKNADSKFKNTFTSLLFTSSSDNQIINAIKDLDILSYRIPAVDTLISEIHIVESFEEIHEKYLPGIEGKYIDYLHQSLENLAQETINRKYIVNSIIRLAWLGKTMDCDASYYEIYNAYLHHLKGYNSADEKAWNNALKPIFEIIQKALYSILGDKDGRIVSTTKNNERIQITHKLRLKPDSHNMKTEIPRLSSPKKNPVTTIQFIFIPNDVGADGDVDVRSKSERLTIDYNLFQLLYKINKGYRPNNKDHSDSLPFFIFADKIVQSCQSEETELQICDKVQGKMFNIRLIEYFGESYEFDEVKI